MRRIAYRPIFHTAVLISFVSFATFTSAETSTTRQRQMHSADFAYWISVTSGRPMSFTAPSSPDNWLGGSGNWSNGADWSAGEPGSGSDVFINTGNDHVMLDTSASINSLTLGGSSGSSTLIDPQSTGSYTVTIAGALTINQSGNLILEQGDAITANASSSNAGGISLTGARFAVNGDFTNSGGMLLIEGFGPAGISVSGNFINNGNISDVSAVDSISVGGRLTNSGFLSVAGLSVGGALTNTGTLQLVELPESPIGLTLTPSAASLNNSGTIDVGNTFTIAGNATNSGTIDVFALAFSASLDIGGTLTNTSTGQISVSDDSSLGATNLTNSGRVQVGTFGALDISGNVTNSGMIAANGNSSILSVGGRFTNNAGGSLALTTSGAATIANLVNVGTVTVGNGASLTIPPPARAIGNALGGFLNSGNVTIASGGTISSPAQYTQTAGQTTVDGHLSGIVNFAGGSVYGNDGTITGNVTSNASINIGDAPMTVGLLTFHGNYTQKQNGSLTFDIASLSQYDQLNVSGHAQLNGLMTVDLIHGYIPQIGNMFDIMNFASQSGTFSTVLGLPINNQEHFVLEYNATNLTLDVVSGPGLQATSGHSRSSSSEPFISPIMNGMSFESVSYQGASSPTPEPGSILLFGSGVAAVTAFRRRGQKG